MRGDVAGAEKDERLRREGIKAGSEDSKLLTSCLCKFQSLLQSATVLWMAHFWLPWLYFYLLFNYIYIVILWQNSSNGLNDYFMTYFILSHCEIFVCCSLSLTGGGAVTLFFAHFSPLLVARYGWCLGGWKVFTPFLPGSKPERSLVVLNLTVLCRLVIADLAAFDRSLLLDCIQSSKKSSTGSCRCEKLLLISFTFLYSLYFVCLFLFVGYAH